jgi:hypothetical protein
MSGISLGQSLRTNATHLPSRSLLHSTLPPVANKFAPSAKPKFSENFLYRYLHIFPQEYNFGLMPRFLIR